MNSAHGLNDDEIALAAGLLAKLEPGYLPEQLFDQIVRLHVNSTVVVVPLKKIAEEVQVLLIQRGTGPNEPVWPGHWHLPGSMLRPTDIEGSYSSAFARVLHGELNGVALGGEPIFVRAAFTQTKRGRELTQLYYVSVVGEPTHGAFFPLDNLPRPIIEHETVYIEEAAKAFLSKETSRS